MTQKHSKFMQFGLTFKVKQSCRSESEFKCAECSHVTPFHVTMHMHTIPSPSVKTLGERRVLRYPPPPLPFSKKPKIFIHFLEWYTTLSTTNNMADKRNLLAISLIFLSLVPLAAAFRCLGLLFFTLLIERSHQRRKREDKGKYLILHRSFFHGLCPVTRHE